MIRLSPSAMQSEGFDGSGRIPLPKWPSANTVQLCESVSGCIHSSSEKLLSQR